MNEHAFTTNSSSSLPIYVSRRSQCQGAVRWCLLAMAFAPASPYGNSSEIPHGRGIEERFFQCFFN